MVWLLLVTFQLKHFFADYPLQTRYMLGKFNKYPDYVEPLLAHVAVHGTFTFCIAMCVAPVHVAMWLAIFDMVCHFIMDRIKASPDMLGKFTALSKREMIAIISKDHLIRDNADEKAIESNTFFWWCLELDQSVHHLTHYVIIWWLLS